MIALTDGQTVAIISGAFALLVALIGLVGRQNTKQHNQATADREANREAVMTAINRVDGKVDTVTTILTDHISDHEHGGK